MANKGVFEFLRWIAIVVATSIATASPALADFDRSKAWFTSLGDEVRVTLQTNLTLAGFYDAFIDGAFGPSTYRGLTGFQKWNGESVTGVLTDASIRALSRASDAVITELDLQILQDERGQMELAVPRALLPQTAETSVGTAYTRPDGLMRLDTVRQPYTAQSFEDFYRQLATENERRRVSYKTFQDSYFVVSGSLDAGFFYSLMFREDEESVGFTLNWTEPYSKEGSIVSLFLASFATPWTGEGPDTETPVQTVGPASDPAPSTVLPASNEAAVVEIGNFLIFKELPGVIGLRGDIGPSTPLDFRRALRAVDDPKVLMLASDGGYVSSALLLAYEVKELGLSTYVLPETGCYSACSFVFFAGAERKVDGALGVHQVWGDDADASTAQTVVSDILEAFADFGVRQEVTSAMLRTPPDDMYVFSSTELAKWGINAGDPTPDIAGPAVDVVPAGDAVSTVPQTSRQGAQVDERSIPIPSIVGLGTALRAEGFTEPAILAIEQALSTAGIATLLEAGSEVRVLYGPSRDGQTIAYRVTVHRGDGTESVAVALSDAGTYVLVAPDEGGPDQHDTADGKGPRPTATSGVQAYVQLASTRSEAEARRAAQGVVSRFGALFGGADVEVQRVDLGTRGVYYRVRVPAQSPEAASNICNNVVAAGGDCVVM